MCRLLYSAALLNNSWASLLSDNNVVISKHNSGLVCFGDCFCGNASICGYGTISGT